VGHQTCGPAKPVDIIFPYRIDVLIDYPAGGVIQVSTAPSVPLVLFAVFGDIGKAFQMRGDGKRCSRFDCK
jgi:hypothetical protein